MLLKKIKHLGLSIMLLTNITWAVSQGLNGILTFDEYVIFGSKRTGVTSFELIEGVSKDIFPCPSQNSSPLKFFVETSNGMVSKLVNEDVLLRVEIQEKDSVSIPIDYNKKIKEL